MIIPKGKHVTVLKGSIVQFVDYEDEEGVPIYRTVITETDAAVFFPEDVDYVSTVALKKG